MPQLDYSKVGIAAYEDGDSFTDIPLFTGDRPVHNDTFTIALSQTIEAYTVLARDTNGDLVPAVYGGTAPTDVPVAIAMVSVTTDGVTKADIPCYTGGTFNPDYLYWDASFDTDAKKLGAFGEASDSEIAIKKMRG